MLLMFYSVCIKKKTQQHTQCSEECLFQRYSDLSVKTGLFISEACVSL